MTTKAKSEKVPQAGRDKGGYAALMARIEKRLKGMSKEERVQTLVSAGILTPRGERSTSESED